MSTLLLIVVAASTASNTEGHHNHHHHHKPPDTMERAVAMARAGRNNRTLTRLGGGFLNAAWQAVQDVSDVEGDIVECGVYRGGASMVMAWSEMAAHPERLPESRRKLWLFDTFQGLPPPSREDGSRSKREYAAASKVKSSTNASAATSAFEEGTRFVDQNGTVRWNYGPLDEVRENMRSTSYPMESVRLVEGKVEQTLRTASNLPKRIAVLRLDTDWYESTRAELKVLYPLLSEGGILIIDDFCTWAGARHATYTWLQSGNRTLVAQEYYRDRMSETAAMSTKKRNDEAPDDDLMPVCFTAKKGAGTRLLLRCSSSHITGDAKAVGGELVWPQSHVERLAGACWPTGGTSPKHAPKPLSNATKLSTP